MCVIKRRSLGVGGDSCLLGDKSLKLKHTHTLCCVVVILSFGCRNKEEKRLQKSRWERTKRSGTKDKSSN